jgi:hypothetical protein
MSMANTATGSLTQRSGSRDDRRVWSAAYVTVILGAIAAISAYWQSAHAVGLVLGALALPCAAVTQMLSTSTNQRWFAICGAVAGGFGMAMGIAHGGL